MKRVKNYIETELAKKKITRYKHWSIKDENGITIISSDDNAEDRSFGEMLDKIISDNVDAEVQVKYGTNEQSSRQNPPFFIKVNQEIEWIKPEDDEEIKINGVPHKVDKNGNVNINFTTSSQKDKPEVETAVPIDVFRTEMETQLQGLRKEYELKEEKWQMDMHNKLSEQNLKFKEMLLSERENRISQKEQELAVLEAELEEKQKEIREDVKGYVKQIPSALGGFIKDWIKEGGKNRSSSLSGAKKEKPRKRSKMEFSIENDEEPLEEMDITEEDLQGKFEFYEQEKELPISSKQTKEEEQTEDIQQTKEQENEEV